MVVLQPYIFLGVFHYFVHNGHPASKMFNPRLSFDYFNPATILIKKNLALDVLRYGLGRNQPRLVILATYISRLSTKICPNELIFHAQIEGKRILTPLVLKNQFDEI